MARSDAVRLRDIQVSIGAIRAHVEFRDVAGVPEGLVEDAVKYRLVEIGEAVGDLSDSTRSLSPTIPWTRVKGLRNFLTHEYHRVDTEVVWMIVDTYLDPLSDAVHELLAELDF
jgi:uncharacterized protein with HEPN domain